MAREAEIATSVEVTTRDEFIAAIASIDTSPVKPL
jgi:hypothetical protein